MVVRLAEHLHHPAVGLGSVRCGRAAGLGVTRAKGVFARAGISGDQDGGEFDGAGGGEGALHGDRFAVAVELAAGRGDGEGDHVGVEPSAAQMANSVQVTVVVGDDADGASVHRPEPRSVSL